MPWAFPASSPEAVRSPACESAVRFDGAKHSASAHATCEARSGASWTDIEIVGVGNVSPPGS
jgi:hypothetical protein